MEDVQPHSSNPVQFEGEENPDLEGAGQENPDEGAPDVDEAPDYPESSELGQIRALFEREQEQTNFELTLPGYNGQFVAICRPVSDAEWAKIEKKLERKNRRDDLASRNYKLDTLISGIIEIRVAAEDGAEPRPLQETAPEIVGTDDTAIRFGDDRFKDFLEVLGAPNCTTARSQLLKLLKNEPIRVVNLFAEYYEYASGESEDLAEELQGE